MSQPALQTGALYCLTPSLPLVCEEVTSALNRKLESQATGNPISHAVAQQPRGTATPARVPALVHQHAAPSAPSLSAAVQHTHPSIPPTHLYLGLPLSIPFQPPSLRQRCSTPTHLYLTRFLKLTAADCRTLTSQLSHATTCAAHHRTSMARHGGVKAHASRGTPAGWGSDAAQEPRRPRGAGAGDRPAGRPGPAQICRGA